MIAIGKTPTTHHSFPPSVIRSTCEDNTRFVQSQQLNVKKSNGPRMLPSSDRIMDSANLPHQDVHITTALGSSKKRLLKRNSGSDETPELCFHKRPKFDNGRTAALKRRRVVHFDLTHNTSRDATSGVTTTGNTTATNTTTGTPAAQAHPEYSPADLWWTRDEMSGMMDRHANLLDFYFDVCPELVEHVIVLWLSCATNYMAVGSDSGSSSGSSDDGKDDSTTTTASMSSSSSRDPPPPNPDEIIDQSPAERAATALLVAQSPLRGLEQDICRAWMSAHRQDHASRVLELQHACVQARLSQDATAQTLAPMARQGTCPSNLFVQVLAAADQYVLENEDNAGDQQQQ